MYILDVFGHLAGIDTCCNWYLHDINIFSLSKNLSLVIWTLARVSAVCRSKSVREKGYRSRPHYLRSDLNSERMWRTERAFIAMPTRGTYMNSTGNTLIKICSRNFTPRRRCSRNLYRLVHQCLNEKWPPPTPPVISVPSPPRTRTDRRDFTIECNLTFLDLFQESFLASGQESICIVRVLEYMGSWKVGRCMRRHYLCISTVPIHSILWIGVPAFFLDQ